VAASDVRRAAVLLASLPAEQAAALLSRLAPAQVEAVSLEIARLGVVALDEQHSAIRQFSESGASGIQGGLELAGALLHKALGAAAAGAVDNIRRKLNPAPFEFLAGADGLAIYSLLREERPQTIALVLSRLPAPQSASALAALPATLREDVSKRIATIGPTHAILLRDVERTLAARWQAGYIRRLDAAHAGPRGSSLPAPHFVKPIASGVVDAT
jgi:flagellar motor switch protein FliG